MLFFLSKFVFGNLGSSCWCAKRMLWPLSSWYLVELVFVNQEISPWPWNHWNSLNIFIKKIKTIMAAAGSSLNPHIGLIYCQSHDSCQTCWHQKKTPPPKRNLKKNPRKHFKPRLKSVLAAWILVLTFYSAFRLQNFYWRLLKLNKITINKKVGGGTGI